MQPYLMCWRLLSHDSLEEYMHDFILNPCFYQRNFQALRQQCSRNGVRMLTGRPLARGAVVYLRCGIPLLAMPVSCPHDVLLQASTW